MGGVLEVCGECYNIGEIDRPVFLFCLPLLSILFLKTKRNDLARPVMATIFLVLRLLTIKEANVYIIHTSWASEASPTLGCSIEISVCRYVSVVS